MTMENKKTWDKLLTVFSELSPLLSALCGFCSKAVSGRNRHFGEGCTGKHASL